MNHRVVWFRQETVVNMQRTLRVRGQLLFCVDITCHAQECCSYRVHYVPWLLFHHMDTQSKENFAVLLLGRFLNTIVHSQTGMWRDLHDLVHHKWTIRSIGYHSFVCAESWSWEMYFRIFFIYVRVWFDARSGNFY